MCEERSAEKEETRLGDSEQIKAVGFSRMR